MAWPFFFRFIHYLFSSVCIHSVSVISMYYVVVDIGCNWYLLVINIWSALGSVCVIFDCNILPLAHKVTKKSNIFNISM